MEKLIGKTIKSIEFPDFLEIEENGNTDTFNDTNILITFTDGTILKLSSWDGDSYLSGIAKQIIIPNTYNTGKADILNTVLKEIENVQKAHIENGFGRINSLDTLKNKLLNNK